VSPDTLLFAALLALPLLPVAGLYLFFVRHRVHLGSRHHALRLVAGNLLVLLLLLSLALLGGESYYRFVYDTTEAAALTKTTHRWLDRHYRRNGWGMRDGVEYQDPIPAGRRRVTFLGDSFTVGLGVADVEDRFVNLVRARRPDWDVHMLADFGWQTGEALANPNLNRPTYQLDCVALVYCLNDAADLNHDLNAYVQSIADSAPRPGLLIRHSYLLDQLFWRTVERGIDSGRYHELMTRGYGGRPWEAQLARMQRLRDLVHQRGGRLVAITFPFFNDPWPAYPYAEVHRTLDAAWADLGVPHLDLLDTYREYPPHSLSVNPRDTHPNERAHALAADAMLPFLDRELVAPGVYHVPQP
jgi:hypothetical protein